MNMRKLFLFLLIMPVLTLAQSNEPTLTIIPKPVMMKQVPGSLTVSKSIVVLDVNNAFAEELSVFNTQLQHLTGFTAGAGSLKNPSAPFIRLVNKELSHPEGYTLQISKKVIEITGSKAGVFYGLQSLFQLIAANYSVQQKAIVLPLVTIQDYPRFSWRGMHLDVCRHFFTKEEVKKYLDYLALYKMNVFHWHLTEDQGWRIEIKKYPLLTEIGSKRKGTIVGLYSKDAPLDGVPHGGFYTQEDIKEVVAYAKARHITVVPEIEMPGHALAALSAYPQLSCNGGPFEPATTWGVFDDVFCAGNEDTFTFLQDVLTEVCDLFPSTYIHVGGDECPKTRWKSCSKCQARIKAEGLADEHALQSYFIKRMEVFLNSKGKKIIGWDEILEGGLAPNASVMSWRGTQGGIEAAKQKHTVVMTPGSPCYFDHYQSKPTENEPLAIGGFNSLEAVYNYEPIPSELNEEEKKFILGAQGNMWTEYMPDFAQVEYMALPRMSALSEVLWTPAADKNYFQFIQRLKIHSRLLDHKKVNYAKHFLNQK
jgi:hexosaminidase